MNDILDVQKRERVLARLSPGDFPVINEARRKPSRRGACGRSGELGGLAEGPKTFASSPFFDQSKPLSGVMKIKL